jgi:hypothetical protein
MGLINPSRGVVDFDSFRALQPLYDAAKAAGIWIVLRPGASHPHVDAILLTNYACMRVGPVCTCAGVYFALLFLKAFDDSTSMLKLRRVASRIGQHQRSRGYCARMPQTGARHGKITSKESSNKQLRIKSTTAGQSLVCRGLHF